jgi:protein SCO1/2
VRTGVAFALALALLIRAAPAASAAERLPELGPAPAFALMSQDKRPVNLIGLRGKIVVVTFLFTACPDICPVLTQKLVEVQNALGPEFGAKVAFVAITLDPEHDTPEVLKGYAQAFEADLAGWSFLTGPVAVVRDVVKRYGVFAAKNSEGFVDHNLVTSIVDARGVLRVQYLGMRFDPDEFRRDLLSLVQKP